MQLSPEILKMRDALLDRLGNKSLKEVAQIVNEILINETNSTNRLAALAARVKVLRNFINKNYNVTKASKTQDLKNKINKDSNNNSSSEIVNTEKSEKWVRVEMLKPGVVNGVRFPQGVVIDVSENDSEKLVKPSRFFVVNLQKDLSV